MNRKRIRIGMLVMVMALVAAACSNTDSDDTTTTAAAATTTAATAATTTTAAAATTTAASAVTTTAAGASDEVAFDIGVTAEPCPEGNPDNGCIYLGILTDQSGPFQSASPALVGAQRAFWAAANAAGGIGGAFDVAMPDDLTKDTQYSPEVFVQQYNDIAGEIAAVGQSLGTSQSIAALDDMARDSTVAAPMSWWSGWAFDELDKGLIIEFGTNYCFEAMNAFDWSMEAVPAAGRPTRPGGHRRRPEHRTGAHSSSREDQRRRRRQSTSRATRSGSQADRKEACASPGGSRSRRNPG